MNIGVQDPAFNSCFSFWLHGMACGILVPRPGIEPMPPEEEVWILNYWTTREIPLLSFLLGIDPEVELLVHVAILILRF